jgi:hypothetical protein
LVPTSWNLKVSIFSTICLFEFMLF